MSVKTYSVQTSSGYEYVDIPKVLIDQCYRGIERDAEDVVLQEYNTSREKIFGNRIILLIEFRNLLEKATSLSNTQKEKAMNSFASISLQQDKLFRRELKGYVRILASGKSIKPLNRKLVNPKSRYFKALKELEEYLQSHNIMSL